MKIKPILIRYFQLRVTNPNQYLQVYNDRIVRLSRDMKEARHRADSYQRKLRDLVQACKTQDVEQVSKLAVEVDTGVPVALPFEDLPPWKQQVNIDLLFIPSNNI